MLLNKGHYQQKGKLNMPHQEFELRLVSPSFDSPLTTTLMELNHLRKQKLGGSTRPFIFFQLKYIFQMLESIGSARIEGNHTTISEYVERKIETDGDSSEQYTEIENVEKAMDYVAECIEEGTTITNVFIRELHQITVGELNNEGDKTPGSYRAWSVNISQSAHTPPDHLFVQQHMDDLLHFINNNDPEQFDLIKIAIAHHRFTWIHPFGNGNGRVVRLLTYAMLIKYGFNVKSGQILNPTAVFCNDRDLYYSKLAVADLGDDKSLLDWCEYVLSGILSEISKVNKLLDFEYLYEHILVPTIDLAVERGYLNKNEESILRVGIELQEFKSSDLDNAQLGLTQRQRTHAITKTKESGYIRSVTNKGRSYHVVFMNNFLMRCLVQILEKEKFIPKIDN